MRQLSARQMAAITGRAPIRTATLIRVTRPDAEPLNVWTGPFPLDHDNTSYIAGGLVMGIEPLRSSDDIAISQIALKLSGVPKDGLSTLEGLDVSRWLLTFYGALFDDDWRMIDRPFEIESAIGDHLAYDLAENGTYTITLRADTGFAFVARPIATSWTKEEQAKDFPDDTGFDLIPGLVGKELTWTRDPA